MKILIRTSDNVVIYAEPNLTLSADGTRGDGWYSPQFTTANAHLDDAELPAGWTGAVWSYVSGVWAVADAQAQAARVEAARIAAVPKEVTMRQARRALREAGLLGNVGTAIAALPSPQKEDAQIEWEYSQVVERHRGLVLSIGTALGLTSRQLDDLFTTAATL